MREALTEMRGIIDEKLASLAGDPENSESRVTHSRQQTRARLNGNE